MSDTTDNMSPWWRDEVVYQIYPRSFKDSNGDGVGDIPGITSKLDYLADLGVTMLWLCPVFASPMVDNGYDISDYRAVAPEFGTLADLDELILKAKARGIKILLDLVLNHTSDQHEWFRRALADPTCAEHGYYIFKQASEPPTNWRTAFGGNVWEKVPGRDEFYFHTFAPQQPDLNWENPALREKLYEIIDWWLDRGVAGFRIDAITSIKKNQAWPMLEADGVDGLAKVSKAGSNQPGIEVFLTELKERVFARRGCFTVAEAPGVPFDQLAQFAGYDGYFSCAFDFKAADIDIASGSEWFRRLPWTVADLRDLLARQQEALRGIGFTANFIENHDQPRATTKYLLDAADNPEAVKTLGAMYFLQRGIPFIYQGQELGMVNFERASIDEFDDVSSHDQYGRSMKEGLTPDEALHIVNLRSRDNTRTPFPWTAERFGGFSDHEPWLGMTEEHPRVNAAAEQGDPASVLSFYKGLIAFARHGEYADCLVDGQIDFLQSAPNVIAYRRTGAGEVLDCYFNLRGEAVEETLAEGTVSEVVWHTQDAPGVAVAADGSGPTLRLRPYQSAIVRRNA